MTQTALMQLAYISDCQSGTTPAAVAGIHQQAKRNNAINNVTGVLLTTDKHFMQLLEGEPQQVEQTYQRIRQDSRHTNVRLIFSRNTTQRQFPNWHMGLKHTLDHAEHADLLTIINMYGQREHFSDQQADAINLLFSAL
jgi:hypothetical protein